MNVIAFRKKRLIEAGVFLVTAFLIFSLSPSTARQVNPFLMTLNEDYDPLINGVGDLSTYIIWENEFPDGHQYVRCQRAGELPYCDVADDFHTDEIWTITGAQWDAVDNLQYIWDETCDMIIYELTPDGPGALIVELCDVQGSREVIYELTEETWYRYTIDLVAQDMEFDLPVGGYYILLRPVTAGSVGRSNWMTSRGNPFSQSELYVRCEFFGYPNWTAGHEIFPGEYYDVSFRVFGEGENIPELEMGEVSDGLGVKTSVKNIGDGEATNVYWSIEFDGGFIVFPPDGIRIGSFSSFAPGHEETLKTMVIGIGGFLKPMNLTVSVRAYNLLNLEKTIPVKVFMFFVKI